MSLPSAVLEAAERVLSEAAGAPVRIVRCDPLTEELSVARCWTAAGDTVILRTHRSVGGWRTSAEYLLNDHAATMLLNSLGLPVCARLIGADLTAGVQLTEDLGTGPSLDDLLAGSDPEAALAGLMAWARGLGELHARTSGRAEEYERLRDGLGSPMPAEHRISRAERLTPGSGPGQVARVLAVVIAFVETARAARTLPALASWFEKVAGVLRDGCGHAVPEPPLFPAFA